jgi:hypothetical protein
MVNYIDAIKKPFSDLKTLGIGAIVGAIPIVSLLNAGYGLKTAEDVMSKKNKLRAWSLSDLGEYIIKVIMMIIITIVYMIVPVIVIAVGVGAAIATALPAILSGAGDMTAVVSAIMPSLMVGGPIILIGALLALIAAFLLPMATMKWLKKGKIGAAFSIGSVVKNALTIDYIVSLIVIFVYAIILSLVAGLISGILGLIPIIGFILSLIIMGGVSFALGVTEYTILAQVVKD